MWLRNSLPFVSVAKAMGYQRKAKRGVASISAQLQRRCFKIDRGAAIRELESIRGAIKDAELELEMIAAERTFSETISDKLKQKAVILQKFAFELKALKSDIAQTTGYPREVTK